MPKFRIQPHVRLQEWVAEDLGFFREEGLDYEFDPDGFAGASTTTGSSVQPGDVAPMAARSGAFEDMEAGRSCDVSGACHWAVNAAATAQPRQDVGQGVHVCECGIFVAPDSRYRRPEDLAGVKVGVGYHSGSHYSAIQGLEPFLERGADQAGLRLAARTTACACSCGARSRRRTCSARSTTSSSSSGSASSWTPRS